MRVPAARSPAGGRPRAPPTVPGTPPGVRRVNAARAPSGRCQTPADGSTTEHTASRSSASRSSRRSSGVSLFTSSRIRSSVTEAMTQAPNCEALLLTNISYFGRLTRSGQASKVISKSTRRRPLSTARRWPPRSPAGRCGRSSRASKESRAGASKVPSVHTSLAAN